MPDCLTSLVGGRARLRHPALRSAAGVACLHTVIRASADAAAGITSVDCNSRTASALILFDSARLSPDAMRSLSAGWAKQLDALVEADTAQAAKNAVSGTAKKCAALKGRTAQGSPLRWRTLSNRAMLACAVASLVVLAANKTLHATVGTAFVLLAAGHIWQRRKAL